MGKRKTRDRFVTWAAAVRGGPAAPSVTGGRGDVPHRLASPLPYGTILDSHGTFRTGRGVRDGRRPVPRGRGRRPLLGQRGTGRRRRGGRGGPPRSRDGPAEGVTRRPRTARAVHRGPGRRGGRTQRADPRPALGGHRGAGRRRPAALAGPHP